MIDLHTHSTYSDGTLTPAELVAQAEKAGLTAIALTDHNTVQGLPEFIAAGEKSPVRTVPGIELSTEYEGIELHILALFLKTEHYAPITALLEDYRRRKEESNLQLTRALCRAGMALDYGEIRAKSEGYVNRAVIGAEMTRKGYTASVAEAFKKYLEPGGGFYVPPRRPDTLETIGFVRSIGAVAVLAHPFLDLTEDRLRQLLPKAREQGLAAMETVYSRYDENTSRLAARLAEEFAILPSGGSDFHGENKPDIFLGRLQVEDTYLEMLEHGITS